MDRTKKLESNIWKYTVYLIANKRIFIAILGAYYLTIPGVTAQSIGIILLVSQIAGFLFEIPSGYVADKLGHKTALIVSRFAMFTSSAFFLCATNIIFLIIAGIFMSLANALHSGTSSAFLHDTLRALGREKDYATVMGKTGSIGFAVPVLFVALTPFLVAISFRAPFLLALIVDLIGIIITLLFVTPPVSQKEIEEIRATNFKKIIAEGYRRNFLIFALFSGIMGGFLFAVGRYRAPYQLFLEVPVIWYGVIFGIGRVLASITMAYSGKLRAKTTLFSFYGLQIIIYAVLFLALGFASTWQTVVALFILSNAVQWGLSRVDTTYLVEIIALSKFKATLLSLRSQVQALVAAVTSFGLGYAIERVSYQNGYLLFAIAFIIVLLPLYIYIILKHQTMNTELKEKNAD